MSRQQHDIALITDARYLIRVPEDDYISNIFLEDDILGEALHHRGLSCIRVSWDDEDFDWTSVRIILFRTPWDYFFRFAEFSKWLVKVAALTRLVNPPELINWNIDKRYLRDLQNKNVRIPPTLFIERGEQRSLEELFGKQQWKEGIIKPVVGGAARHTYRFDEKTIVETSAIFRELISEEAMLIQEYQPSIIERGEVAFMVMNGKFTHAVLKKAKAGDFRVQDDFGGTLHDYVPTKEEIIFAEDVVKKCPVFPLYARVDVMWDSQGRPCVSELEVIEPELWFRRHPASAQVLAAGLFNLLSSQ
mgnify:CR=1 FL=1